MCSAESQKDKPDSLRNQDQIPGDALSSKSPGIEGPLKNKEEQAFRKLLLVDGYSPEIDMVQSHLKDLMGKDWEIITADNLEDAMKILKEQKEIGLVVTGMTYPETPKGIDIQESGMVLVRCVKKAHPGVKVAAFSTWEHKLIQAKKDGADFTLPKDNVMISSTFEEFIRKETSEPAKSEQVEEPIKNESVKEPVKVQSGPIFDKLLLVDDNNAMLVAMEYLLEDAVGIGCKLIFATTLEDAKSALEVQGEIPLVITDMSYPEKKGEDETPDAGINFIKYLKEKHPKIVVIAYSSSDDYLKLAKKAGADYTVSKSNIDPGLKEKVAEISKLAKEHQ